MVTDTAMATVMVTDMAMATVMVTATAMATAMRMIRKRRKRRKDVFLISF